MLTRKEQQNNSEKNGAVYPESTIESASKRNYVQRPDVKQSSNKLVCESTIDSAPRRDFIRKAALVTAAVAVGGTALGSKVLPESSANSTTVTTCRSNSAGRLAVWNGPSSITSAGCGYPGCTFSSGFVSCSLQLSSKCPNETLYVENLYGSSPLPGGGWAINAKSSFGAAIIACGYETGVLGISSLGAGVGGCSDTGNGVVGHSLCGIGVLGESCGKNAVPLVARARFSSSVANLQQWEINGCPLAQHGVPVSVVNKCGWFGIGTATPSATLDVKGNAHIAESSPSSAVLIVNNLSSCTVVANGIQGTSIRGTGVCGASCSGFAVAGISKSSIGVFGGSTSGTSLFGGALGPGAVPIIAQGAAGQTANLQQWENSASTRLSVVDKCGHFGIGTSTPHAALCVVGTVQASSCSTTILGVSHKAQGIFGQSFSGNSVGVVGVSCGSGTGVLGCSASGSGVQGQSTSGPGVLGQSSFPTVGKFKNNGKSGDRTALVQFETGPSCKLIDWNAGVAGLCNACKIADGSFYVGQKGKPSVVVNTSGQVGIGTTNPVVKLDVVGNGSVSGVFGVGTTSPQTTLQVKGGMSLELKAMSSNYTMTTSDFAILASGAITITLPPASKTGMVVYVKNISTSTVTVSRGGMDTFEGGKTSLPLSTQFGSLTLIAGGGSPGVWYILANAT
jgi:hypothetical protein